MSDTAIGNPAQGAPQTTSQNIPGNSAAASSIPASPPSSGGKGSSRFMMIGAAAAVIIIAVIAFFAYSSLHTSSTVSTSNSLSASSPTAGNQSNPISSKSTTYAKIAALFSSGKTVSLHQFNNVSGINPYQILSNPKTTSVNLLNNTNVSYTGSGEASILLSGVNLAIPFSYLIGSDTNGNYSRTSINARILNSNVSELIINTPVLNLACGNQNQSSLALSLLGGSSSSSHIPPDYACVAKEVQSNSINQSQKNTSIKIANYIANNIFINASNVSDVSYRGNSCIYLKGYVTSKNLALGNVLNNSALNNSQTSSISSGLSSAIMKFKGPYSTCISASTGIPYNFSTNLQLNITSPPSPGQAKPSSLNVNFSITTNMAYYGKASTTQVLSEVPYRIMNGTCQNGINLNVINSSYSAYFACNNVNMNSSGSALMELKPSKNMNLFSIPNATVPQGSKIRILGLYCEKTNSSATASFYASQPNATLFTPVNLTFASNQSFALAVNCPGAILGKQYNGTVYAVTQEDTLSSSTTAANIVNVSSSIGTFSVLPTINGNIGINQNSGPVSNHVVLPSYG